SKTSRREQPHVRGHDVALAEVHDVAWRERVATNRLERVIADSERDPRAVFRPLLELLERVADERKLGRLRNEGAHDERGGDLGAQRRWPSGRRWHDARERGRPARVRNELERGEHPPDPRRRQRDGLPSDTPAAPRSERAPRERRPTYERNQQ